MKLNKKKKAFTLTELLVVVIIIGVLSAVVLPKFNKIVETRKTTEAEELMAAVRTEQEKRCAFDKDYLTDASKLTSVLPSTETKNFEYSFTSTGIKAASRGKYSYELQMPSYADGRICCENETECLKLNKDYPLCSELLAKADYDDGTACAGEVTPSVIECSGLSSQACGCKNGGTQTRICDTSTGTWSEWSACSIADTCECTGIQPAAIGICGNCGSRTRSVTCNSSTGVWETGAWASCSGEGVCAAGTTEQTSCAEGETGTKTRTCTSSCTWGAWTGSCTPAAQYKWVEFLNKQHTILASSEDSFCYNANDPGFTNWKTEMCALAKPPRSCSFNTCGTESPAGSNCSTKGAICYVGSCAGAGATHGIPRARLTAVEYHCE